MTLYIKNSKWIMHLNVKYKASEKEHRRKSLQPKTK